MQTARTHSPTIGPSNPCAQDCRALLRESDEALLAVYPPDEIFTVDADELAVPNAIFLTARQGPDLLGCVALMDMLHYGEVKRLFVRPGARGLGLARGLMRALERHARDLGLRCLRLESGAALAAAVALYRDLGFAPCPAFGGHPDIDSNLFLEKRLI